MARDNAHPMGQGCGMEPLPAGGRGCLLRGISAMTFTVFGTPAPQGSKRHVGNGVMIESSKKVKPWRQAVEYAALEALPFRARLDPIVIRGPVDVGIVFSMHRPKSAKKCAMPDRKPDIDQLCRSTLDSLVTSGMIEDDARIVSLSAVKLYAGDRKGLPVPGAIISITHASQN